ncbi:MAG: glycosyltransferase [Bacteroidales bacterium]|nr:glycosyltransferase [Bacteroidales bacterium]
MKVLIVASFNRQRFAPFIEEQVDALKSSGVDCEFFGIEGKGIKGYLASLAPLKKRIEEFGPDVIHAHYGLSCLLACLQRSVPVVSTYHGSDINVPKVLRFSRIAMRLSAYNIFVSVKNAQTAGLKKNYSIIPCGIDLGCFPFQSKEDARNALGWVMDEKKVLFAGAFDNAVKNSALAKEAVSLLPGVELVELKGYSRQQISTLMHAADAFLMTSFSEGSPQVVKEAMACGCPIVSVDVGDVKEVIDGVDGCYAVDRDARRIADALENVMTSGIRTTGRDRIISLGLENMKVAERLISIYQSVIG